VGHCRCERRGRTQLRCSCKGIPWRVAVLGRAPCSLLGAVLPHTCLSLRLSFLSLSKRLREWFFFHIRCAGMALVSMCRTGPGLALPC
jgi:hypothetical protein